MLRNVFYRRNGNSGMEIKIPETVLFKIPSNKATLTEKHVWSPISHLKDKKVKINITKRYCNVPSFYTLTWFFVTIIVATVCSVMHSYIKVKFINSFVNFIHSVERLEPTISLF